MKSQHVIATTMVLMLMGMSRANATTISVRLVDVGWAPLSGISVHLQETESCEGPPFKGKSAAAKTTDVEGLANFSDVTPSRYLVTADAGDNGFEKRQQCVDLTRTSSGATAYVELRLRLDPMETVDLLEPATGGSTASGGPISLAAFLGAYRSRNGDVLDVGLMESGSGVIVEFPDLHVLHFPLRHATTFQGPDGVVTFEVRGRKVIGLTLVPRSIIATQKGLPGSGTFVPSGYARFYPNRDIDRMVACVSRGDALSRTS